MDAGQSAAGLIWNLYADMANTDYFPIIFQEFHIPFYWLPSSRGGEALPGLPFTEASPSQSRGGRSSLSCLSRSLQPALGFLLDAAHISLPFLL